VAVALAVTLSKRVSDGSLRKNIGSVAVTGITAAGTQEDATLITGLRQVESITFTQRYVAGTLVNPMLQDDETLPSGGSVAVSVANNGTFYFEAVGYGM